jgi:hypothetical protein
MIGNALFLQMRPKSIEFDQMEGLAVVVVIYCKYLWSVLSHK